MSKLPIALLAVAALAPTARANVVITTNPFGPTVSDPIAAHLSTPYVVRFSNGASMTVKPSTSGSLADGTAAHRLSYDESVDCPGCSGTSRMYIGALTMTDELTFVGAAGGIPWTFTWQGTATLDPRAGNTIVESFDVGSTEPGTFGQSATLCFANTSAICATSLPLDAPYTVTFSGVMAVGYRLLFRSQSSGFSEFAWGTERISSSLSLQSHLLLDVPVGTVVRAASGAVITYATPVPEAAPAVQSALGLALLGVLSSRRPRDGRRSQV